MLSSKLTLCYFKENQAAARDYLDSLPQLVIDSFVLEGRTDVGTANDCDSHQCVLSVAGKRNNSKPDHQFHKVITGKEIRP